MLSDCINESPIDKSSLTLENSPLLYYYIKSEIDLQFKPKNFDVEIQIVVLKQKWFDLKIKVKSKPEGIIQDSDLIYSKVLFISKKCNRLTLDLRLFILSHKR